MLDTIWKTISGRNDARVKAYRPDTAAGTAAIQAQARQSAGAAQAGAYGLAASQRGGMGSALAVREAQKRGAMAQQGATSQALMQQQQLEQQAASQYAQQQQAASQANAGIEGQNARGIQQLAGVAAGALMMSDERAKKLSEENDGLRSTLLRLVGREPATTERRQLQQPEQYKGQYFAPPMTDEADAMEAEKRFRLRNEAALAQQLRDEEQRAQLTQMRREQLGRVRQSEAGYQQQIPQEVALSDERAKGGYAEAKAPKAPGEQESKGLLGMLSDERGKMGMGMHGGMEFPDGVKPVEYEYRDEVQGMPGTEPGKQYGLLAQDLEKSKEGETVVEEDPMSGMKMVDTGRLAMLATAKLAEMEDRLDRMEGRPKKRKGSR